MPDIRPATLGDVQRLEDRVEQVERDLSVLKTAQATTSLKYVFLSAIGSSIPVLLSIAIYLITRK